MNYLSVCSGIEAATVAWHGLGWKAAGFAEIEKFPSAVLKERFPDVTNYGDMTKYKEWKNVGTVDLLVGGTPCQSFSVAGLRKGLADPRGNLMLTFGAIAHHFKARWVVWENVPGVLSTNNGDDFKSFLDMLNELGYIVDVDIHDAQFHGVAQRRRRVFVLGQRVDFLLRKRTDTSLLTIIQFLQEILQKTLIGASFKLENEQENLDFQGRLKDGVRKRIDLFLSHGGKDSSRMLQDRLVEAFQKHLQEQKNSGVIRGGLEKELILADLLMGLKTEDQSTLIEELLRKTLEESLKVARLYTTLTTTETITQYQIFMCSKIVLTTARLIAHLNPSCQNFWSAGLSSLTTLKEYIKYARQTSSELFGDMERNDYWVYFVKQAEQLCESIGSIRVSNFGEIFPIAESLSGNPPPSREKGKGIAFNAQGSASQGLSAGRTSPTLDKSKVHAICYGIPGNWIGRKPENGGNATTPMVDLSPCITGMDRPAVCYENHGQDSRIKECGAVSPTLNCNKALPIVKAQGGANAEITEGLSTTLNCNHESPIIADSFQLRRFTPRECERLQGFPDDWTKIPWGNKPAEQCPDSPRYKACGNSMAVPVMRWIGERIDKQEKEQK
jgi:DNA-cytosine methyltransferase